ncbi:MAG: FAD:protein FMN transferase [Ignavibacterium album]|uniref:FAD:protein FMN transferase n=1 Tax=Ignavibacterium album TaxID=591197 RepID=UPI0026F02F76|nr:FAD:protein FMN transferase [Ignavibacterium album]MCX8104391.1 FAD:protein FMN transferase [Ignavibacterium album]
MTNYYKSKIYIIVAVVLFLIGFFIARNSSDELKTFKRTQILLGTVVEIQVRDKDEQKVENAITKAFAEIKRIDDLFTTYNEESPVWKINYSADTVLKIDDEIYNLLVLCDSVTTISNGCFDVSLDNLTRAWGFYTDNPKLPSKAAIDSALSASGWKNIKLTGNNIIVKKRIVGLNFGAIAKGYAVDKAIEILKTVGIESALVNAGGEIKVIGKDWKVGIQHPRDERDIIAVVRLENNSVATSGDYEQFFEVDGIRYHHLLDPKSGYPARGLQSVTIINPSNTFADALATAVFVMGKDEGIKLIESLDDTEGMIVDGNGNIFYSSGFKKYLIN